MDYYGLLFLYYLKGLSGKSILRLFFNIEVGGTEQLLPENTSTPTTTPILADIQYPDGLRTDQYFTYRETPTTVSNKARIKTIKGNTLVWNQLVRNGNFVDTTYWNGNGTKTVSNNELTFVKQPRWNSLSNGQLINLVTGHKYLVMFEAYCENADMSIFWITGTGQSVAIYNISSSTTWTKHSLILTSTQTTASGRVPSFDNNSATESIFHLRNYIFVDLTKMGLDSITNPAEFSSLFLLPYYEYNTGILLSFNGNGIKTVGKNLCNIVAIGGISSSTGADVSNNARIRSDYLRVIANQSYTISTSGRNTGVILYDMNKNFVSSLSGPTFTPTIDGFVRLVFRKEDNTDFSSLDEINCQLEFGSSTTAYEPYTSQTTNLPILTYFPTGMKSAGNVYDELTESKAITRVGMVDIGTLDYVYNSASNRFQGPMPSDYKIPASASERENVLCAKYETNSNPLQSGGGNGVTGYQGSSYIFIRDTAYTDATAFKASLNGVYLYYELATPTETPITTEDANEALSLLMGKSVSSNNAKQLINIITKGE